MAQNITDKILAEYDQIRSREGLLRNSRVESAHGRYPELADIKKEITAAGMVLATGIASSPEKADKLKAEYDKKVDALQKRKLQILSEGGIAEDYDKIHYECEACQDTGYISNEKCKCFKLKKIKYAYENSNLSEKMKNSTFENFKMSYYSDEKDAGGISDKMRAEKALAASKNIASNLEEYEKSLLFVGNVGLGKTFLSGCIANELIKQGYSVLYIRSSTLFTIFEDKKFGKISEKDSDMVDMVYDCDMLIIDDLGTEIPSKFTASFLHDIVNERMLHGKKLIISTNFSSDELSKLYTPRFISRLYENFFVFKLTGMDIRKRIAHE